MRAVALSLMVLTLLALGSTTANAHALSPWYLSLRETEGGRVEAVWKIPKAATVEVTPVLPCTREGGIERVVVDVVIEERFMLRCPSSLVGLEVRADGLAGTDFQTLVQVELLDGRSIRAILTGKSSAYTIPATESSFSVFLSYVRLGIEHLLTGLDHMLFLVGLVLLLGATRRLLVGVTAFTGGHSVTLAAASLGLIRVPQSIAELAIAGSIVVLAVELAQTTTAQPGALARRPAVLPFAFGLLHGLGFAGALREVGLPPSAIPLALFSFNVGIEVGQLALIVAILPVLAIARRIPARVQSSLSQLPATAIGGLAMMWCIERALLLLRS